MSLAAAATCAPVVNQGACSHCGLPAEARVTAESGEVFCCSGCETVYFALRSAGLDAYYSKRDGAGAPARPSRGTFEHFDDPGFLEMYATHVDGEARIELVLEGVHCAACLWLIEKLPKVVPGVVEAQLSFAESLVRIRWQPDTVKLSRIAETLDSFGYPPHPFNQARARSLQDQASRTLLAKIGIAGATFGNVMLLSFALYSGDASGMTTEYADFFRWASLVISVPSVMWTAQGFFRGAWASLRTRTPHMDLPVSVGILAALFWGARETLLGSGRIYFDSVTMLVFLLLIGRYIQAYQTRAARNATDLLFALSPSSCRVKTGETSHLVPADSVPKLAIVEIRSGERVGVDGEIVAGATHLDESLLTGETKPRSAGIGAVVHAGTVNLSQRIEVRALRTGRETRLAQLVRDVERAAENKGQTVMLADRLAGYFVVVALGLAVVTYLVWQSRDPEAAFNNAIALLIVTCPCALGMATPLAAGVALGRAARQGILVKGMRFVEQLSRPGLFVFDKTGTLTLGQMRVVDAGPLDTELTALLRAAVQGSAHPVAQALQRDLALAPVRPVDSFHEFLGEGIRATVAGADVGVGSGALMRRLGVEVDGSRTRALLDGGLSPVYVAVDGRLRATLGVGDPIRPEAKDCLRTLTSLGYQLAILSGDRQELVDRTVGLLGIPFESAQGERSPEQKLAFVTERRAAGPVYMVGDGVNDAAALTASDVGIAMSGGAEASLAAADVFSTRAGLSPILELVSGSRRTLRVIHLNIAFSLAYNLLAAGLCLYGVITPLIAAVLMPLSSLTVVTNSLRARTFEKAP
jgi:P-type Cu2+ transporter